MANGISELEHLGRCPICGGAGRDRAYRGVRDGIFATPGEWDYWSCACGLLYLDPRPASRAVEAAYATYYTHRSAGAAPKWREPGFRGAIRRGYLNARYGYRFEKASRLGALTWRLRRSAVKNLDFMVRHLPAPPAGGARLLDVGCGNGDFLAVARDLGFLGVGIDADPQAVELARSRGLEARRATFPGSGEAEARFDHVLLSHVLEHLHDPVGALREAKALLVPGGRLWISLPNLEAAGLRLFGADWRGLEPPRHVALFTARRLAGLLKDCGFARVTLMPPEEAALFYFRQSQAIRHGLDPYGEANPPGWTALRPEAAAANRRARREPRLAESLTFTATRPPA